MVVVVFGTWIGNDGVVVAVKKSSNSVQGKTLISASLPCDINVNNGFGNSVLL